MTDEFFMQTYNKYKNTVYSVVFNYTKNHEDASDISQEVFIKFYTYSEEFNNEEHIKAWLIRVAINLCKNHLRAMKRFSGEEVPEDILTTDNTEIDELLPIVMAMPEKYRVPLHLFYYEDYSITQIADVLGLNEATVKTHLNRGREKLRKSLRKEDWLL